MRRFIPHFAIFATVSGLYLGGLLSSLEYGLTDLAFRLLPRPASGQIVVVEIDTRSLQRLNGWPWPRRYHAAVIERLITAGANRVAIDIDFSAPTTPEDDRRLSNAIAGAAGRIVLPLFRQGGPWPAGDADMLYTAPYAPFAENAALGTVNVRFAGDNTVRHYPTADDWSTGTRPSMASVLAAAHPARPGTFALDYGIQPDSIPRLSYVDVVTGNFRNHMIAGKTVIIGATAGALGDQLRVPVYGVLPGPVVQAMAYESLTQNRALQEAPSLPILATALLIALLVGPLYSRVSGRVGVAIMAGIIILFALSQIAILAFWPILPGMAPVMLVTVLSFLWSLWQRSGNQVVRFFQARPDSMRPDSMRHGSMMHGAVEDGVDGIVITDGNGLVKFVNPMAAALFNIEPDEATGRSIYDLAPGPAK
ncbi:MAG: CHASE2 domain-containing protein [Rhodospirillaceae bacterium]|nr:CHASE2 domain-containing protein [Rhodospirillaceae bacterium]MBT5048002.1 CHASE2 domain-containing protein [Rhodospirillaceae bacterium]MBT5456201.1 CHASE2 domain-containing protein [Rhodospirillaceae bacterium]